MENDRSKQQDVKYKIDGVKLLRTDGKLICSNCGKEISKRCTKPIFKVHVNACTKTNEDSGGSDAPKPSEKTEEIGSRSETELETEQKQTTENPNTILDHVKNRIKIPEKVEKEEETKTTDTRGDSDQEIESQGLELEETGSETPEKGQSILSTIQENSNLFIWGGATLLGLAVIPFVLKRFTNLGSSIARSRQANNEGVYQRGLEEGYQADQQKPPQQSQTGNPSDNSKKKNLSGVDKILKDAYPEATKDGKKFR